MKHLILAMTLLAACETGGAYTEDASNEHPPLDVTPAEQEYLTRQAATLSPGDGLDGCVRTFRLCSALCFFYAGGTPSPAVWACQSGCYRDYFLCTGCGLCL